MAATFELVGRGLYTVAEAERLTRVPSARIRRWTGGYHYRYAGEQHYSPPVIATAVKRIEGSIALDFLDLMEIRFLNAFCEHGVSWRSIRIASECARELIGRRRSFSTRLFKTDGRTILAELIQPSGDKLLLDLVESPVCLRASNFAVSLYWNRV